MSDGLQPLRQVRDLPIAAVVDEVALALLDGNVLLHAEPGAGKSTGLPLALLLKSSFPGKIVMLEPRRLAARGVAERLASQLGEAVGDRVGLRMRGLTRVSPATRLEVVTEGVLTRMLQTDPALEGYDLVIFDEFHERGLHADLGLALCREVQQALRPTLRLLMMSATLVATKLAEHLGDARYIHCQSRQFPVTTVWVGQSTQALPAQITQVVVRALSEHAGDVLVFLPGVAEIEKTAMLLTPRLDEHHLVQRLHSGVSVADQRAATAPANPGIRRVILSTSIAETSLTIEGVSIVVDAGLERRGRMDSHTGAVLLETVTANQSSATQRSGRAGRTAPGVSYRLWSEEGHRRRAESWQAEIHRADLAPLVLELYLWGAKTLAELPWLEKPPAAAVNRAQALLTRLEIVVQGKLTPHGRKVARLPLHPRLGHMVIWADERGAGELASKLAILVEDAERQRRSVDLEQALKLPLSQQQKYRLKRLLRELSLPVVSEEDPAMGVLLAQAYPDWIARRRPTGEHRDPGHTRYALSCGAGAILPADSALAASEWIVVAQLGGQGNEARIYLASSLQLSELEHSAPSLFVESEYLDWDDRQEKVVGESQVRIGELVVSRRPLNNVSEEQRSRALLTGIQRQSLSCLPWTDECREWQARVQRMVELAAKHGELPDFPTVDDASLLRTLDVWLKPYVSGVGSLKALSQISLIRALSAMLDYRQQSLMDEWLPLRYTVPSGSQIKLRYQDKGNPILSVKLQEMFGCSSNPSLAQGRIPIKVELLSPARRPVQVTEDLTNFWHTSYTEVKKAMAGRYPKHHWPDNPLKALPTAKAKPRKKT